jgi:TolC family type I secretion outer membrane protein
MKRSFLLIAVLLLAACSSAPEHIAPSTSPAPATPWVAPASAVPPPLPQEAAPAVENPLPLERAIDIALTNNPNTRGAWLAARISESNLGIARSESYPEVSGSVTANRTEHTTAYGPALSLTYLLFDFGGRAASIEQARQRLVAADYEHNQVIQDVVLQTIAAYYGVLDAKALLEAQGATLKERQTSLEAAEARHRAGVATIADVLEARTALSQAQLNFETIEGGLHQQEGLLARALGVPVMTPIELGALPAEVPVKDVTEKVDTLIAQAQVGRPELAAARADVERSRARVREVRSAYMPTVGVTATASKTFTSGSSTSNPSPYSVGVAVRFPLFTGFRNVYDVRAAELGVQLATETARNLQQQVSFQVWSSYYALSTASQRVRTSRDLLRSAQESVEVAQGRYRSGVGTIIELLTAQAALETARAQEVQARADWFVAVAQLAHDTGSLGPKAEETR